MAMEKGGGWWNEMEEDGKKPPWRSGTRRWVACGEGERTLLIDEACFTIHRGLRGGRCSFTQDTFIFHRKVKVQVCSVLLQVLCTERVILYK